MKLDDDKSLIKSKNDDKEEISEFKSSDEIAEPLNESKNEEASEKVEKVSLVFDGFKKPSNPIISSKPTSSSSSSPSPSSSSTKASTSSKCGEKRKTSPLDEIIQVSF